MLTAEAIAPDLVEVISRPARRRAEAPLKADAGSFAVESSNPAVILPGVVTLDGEPEASGHFQYIAQCKAVAPGEAVLTARMQFGGKLESGTVAVTVESDIDLGLAVNVIRK